MVLWYYGTTARNQLYRIAGATSPDASLARCQRRDARESRPRRAPPEGIAFRFLFYYCDGPILSVPFVLSTLDASLARGERRDTRGGRVRRGPPEGIALQLLYCMHLCDATVLYYLYYLYYLYDLYYLH